MLCVRALPVPMVGVGGFLVLELALLYGGASGRGLDVWLLVDVTLVIWYSGFDLRQLL